jgi:nucleoside-diphosphate-sugar epimerase
MKPSALIGYTGFVGQTLVSSQAFDRLYRSLNIESMKGESFSTVICAGAPAVKWFANKNPIQDKENLQKLMQVLETIEAETFILVSTVDVFKSPVGVSESSEVALEGLHSYGLHRFQLEAFVRAKFPHALVVRLPGLVGRGLKKNVLFDLKNNRPLDQFDHRSKFQFYPMDCLWKDIQIARAHRLSLVHLSAEPVSVGEVAQSCFKRAFSNSLAGGPICYDFQTEFQHLFGVEAPYQYTKAQTLRAITHFANQPEPPHQEAAQSV